MKPPTRRDSLAALLLSSAATASASDAMPSKTFRFEDLPVRKSAQNSQRSVFDGATSSGYPIEMHMTELAPGKMPHAAHKHQNEELLMLREGTLEVTIEGKVSVVGPGSVVYVASNELHGWKNVGDNTAHYFVMALGRTRVR